MAPIWPDMPKMDHKWPISVIFGPYLAILRPYLTLYDPIYTPVRPLQEVRGCTPLHLVGVQARLPLRVLRDAKDVGYLLVLSSRMAAGLTPVCFILHMGCRHFYKAVPAF